MTTKHTKNKYLGSLSRHLWWSCAGSHTGANAHDTIRFLPSNPISNSYLSFTKFLANTLMPENFSFILCWLHRQLVYRSTKSSLSKPFLLSKHCSLLTEKAPRNFHLPGQLSAQTISHVQVKLCTKTFKTLLILQELITKWLLMKSHKPNILAISFWISTRKETVI